MSLSGAQIRAARALLRWSAEELAKRAKLGRITVVRAEAVDGATALTLANADALRRVLEEGGVVFIEANGGGPGVRLRRVPDPG